MRTLRSPSRKGTDNPEPAGSMPRWRSHPAVAQGTSGIRPRAASTAVIPMGSGSPRASMGQGKFHASPRAAAAWAGVVLLALLPFGIAAQNDAAERLQEFLAQTRSLQAEFRQEIFDASGQLIEEAEGVVSLSRPGKFRWEYFEPYRQQVVGDGTEVWIYDADLDQATVSDMEAGLGATPALLLYPDRTLEESFEVKSLGGEGPLQWAELLPRTGESTFTFVRIGLGPEGPRVMELGDTFDQHIRIAFGRLEIDVRFDEGHFRFVPPAGVDVFRR